MKLLFIGDVHASWQRLYDGVHRVCREHDVQAAIQVGDFGFLGRFVESIFAGDGGFRFPIPMFVIDGNHEDHSWIREQVECGNCGRWEAKMNLLLKARGSIVMIGDVIVGFCGGALHVDRSQEGSLDRGTTNWVSNVEADRAAAAFSEWKVDLIVTHSCPHSIGVGMRGNTYLSEDMERHISSRGFSAGTISDFGEPGLLRLWSRLRHLPREWVFGHFHVHHVSEVRGVRFRCIGAIDGSDNLPEPVMYVLDTKSWTWETVKC